MLRICKVLGHLYRGKRRIGAVKKYLLKLPLENFPPDRLYLKKIRQRRNRTPADLSQCEERLQRQHERMRELVLWEKHYSLFKPSLDYLHRGVGKLPLFAKPSLTCLSLAVLMGQSSTSAACR